jgi:glycosyltransferase involved in cell wall biosynthesis
MRVALIHYWLVGMRGGERVLEQLCKALPQADVYTHVLKADRISETILNHRIKCTSIARLPFAGQLYRHYLAFMPKALEEVDLSDYDLVISSESGPAKGVIARPTARHICYCHSPMRYIWDQFHVYRRNLNPVARYALGHIAHSLRQWDVTSAARVDKFVANSRFVADRIRQYYRRDAEIIHPPVSLARHFCSGRRPEDYYLVVSQLVPYKRVDLAVEAFRSLGRPLVVVGEGSERRGLERIASQNICFLGHVGDERLAQLYANCRALIFPGVEDFGLVPLEAMASGRPVIAYSAGGALDTIKDHETGLFFSEQNPASLCEAVLEFESMESSFDGRAIRRHAERFSEERFREQFMLTVEREMVLAPARQHSVRKARISSITPMPGFRTVSGGPQLRG